MSNIFSSETKQQIALKKLLGKSHTKNASEFFNEGKYTGVTSSAEKIFAENITDTPLDNALYATDGIYELVRLKAVPLPESEDVGNVYNAFYLELPDDYEINSTSKKKGEEPFVNGKDLYSTLGRIQLIPYSFGNLYEAKVYKGTSSDTTLGSGVRIPPNDPRLWYLDYYNGILFQEAPPANPNPGSGIPNPNDPLWIEAYIYIGNMISDANYSSVSSLWEYDANNNLQPSNVLDGDTGCWALDMNIRLLNDGEISLTSYTTTTRTDAIDKYFELDDDGNVTIKEE